MIKGGILAIAMIAAAAPAEAKEPGVRIEPDAILPDDSQEMLSLADAAVASIRSNGWRCDSISSMMPFLTTYGFNVVCNDFSYSYNFEKHGGNWTVTAD